MESTMGWMRSIHAKSCCLSLVEWEGREVEEEEKAEEGGGGRFMRLWRNRRRAQTWILEKKEELQETYLYRSTSHRSELVDGFREVDVEGQLFKQAHDVCRTRLAVWFPTTISSPSSFSFSFPLEESK